MLSTLARLLLALTALSPVVLTWALADLGRNGIALSQVSAGAIAALFAAMCWLILRGSQRVLTQISFAATEVKAIDNEAIAFVLTYLVPLLSPTDNTSYVALCLVFILLAFLLSFTHAFTFNPLLAVLGFHFYEVKSSANVTYLVLSRAKLTSPDSIKRVARLSNFLLLDLDS
ncbi:hypothetical protein P3W23_12950 [Luteibacter sp. PPL554]